MSKVILITGGGRGIGAATALMAARQGYAVGINYLHNRTAAEQVANSINSNGGKAVVIQADVSDEQQVNQLFVEMDKQLGTVTALVNNAGILETQARLDAMDAARLQRIFNSNVLSCFLCSRQAVHRMSTRYGGNGGAIVNVSSIAAKTGSPNEYVDYAASKGAVEAMTIGLSKEVAAEGIRVNAVRPGFIYTDIHASGGEPGRVNRIKDTLPMKRGGQPEEVAHAILWLLSNDASFTTGSFIDVTGGR